MYLRMISGPKLINAGEMPSQPNAFQGFSDLTVSMLSQKLDKRLNPTSRSVATPNRAKLVYIFFVKLLFFKLSPALTVTEDFFFPVFRKFSSLFLIKIGCELLSFLVKSVSCCSFIFLSWCQGNGESATLTIRVKENCTRR